MSLNRILSQRSDVAWKEVDGKVILMDLGVNKQVHRLNSVGSYIWENLDGQKSLLSILESLICEFDVSKKQAEVDLLELVLRLEELGVVNGS